MHRLIIRYRSILQVTLFRSIDLFLQLRIALESFIVDIILRYSWSAHSTTMISFPQIWVRRPKADAADAAALFKSKTQSVPIRILQGCFDLHRGIRSQMTRER